MKTIILAFCILLPSLLRAEHLTRVSMEDIIQRLRDRGIPISMERFPTTMDDAITLKRQIELIEAIKSSLRTENEKQTLDSCLRLRKDGHKDDELVNWRVKTFDFEWQSTDDALAILTSVVTVDSDYHWEKTGTSYVVYPKEKSFNLPVKAFIVKDASFEVLMRTMLDVVAKPAALHYMEVHNGPGLSLSEMFKDRKFNIVLKDTDTRTVLCAITEQLGIDFFWEVIGGPAWGRNLGFGRAYKRE